MLVARSEIGLVLAAVAAALVADLLLSLRSPPHQRLGRRAAKRQAALADTPWLVGVLPLLNGCTALTSRIPAKRLRAWLERTLQQADDPLGLLPSEVLGASLLCSSVALTLSTLLGSPIIGVAFFVFGAYWPIDALRQAALGRQAAVSRGLPMATDLMLLGMDAGLDFVSSIRLFVNHTSVFSQGNPIAVEFHIFLQQLELGRSRKCALENMVTRVPARALTAFVQAILQAEEKGIPLAEVLRTQALVLRQGRAQDAEAYIQSANVKLVGPVLLVVIALLILIVVPTLSMLTAGLTGISK